MADYDFSAMCACCSSSASSTSHSISTIVCADCSFGVPSSVEYRFTAITYGTVLAPPGTTGSGMPSTFTVTGPISGTYDPLFQYGANPFCRDVYGRIEPYCSLRITLNVACIGLSSSTLGAFITAEYGDDTGSSPAPLTMKWVSPGSLWVPGSSTPIATPLPVVSVREVITCGNDWVLSSPELVGTLNIYVSGVLDSTLTLTLA